MKLRIHGNSIRLRLSRGEVARFADSGTLTDTLDFGGNRCLSFGLETTPEASSAEVRYRDDHIRVLLPEAVAREWVESNRVEIAAEQSAGNEASLRILVEKDFQCLHRPHDDNPDGYPNPREGS